MTREETDGIFTLLRRMLVFPKMYFLISVYLFIILPQISSFGQAGTEYDEIALFLDVPNLGGRDMDVLILDNEVYLPITDLFDFLLIRNIPSPDLDTITGFFINPEATYLIDRPNNQIRYGDELIQLKPGDLIQTEINLYLKGYYFGQIFGLESEFDFRTMSVRINTRLELPAIREMRLQNMRKNMNRLVGEEEADTTIERDYPIFHFGMADWSANIIEQTNGEVNSRLGLALGGIIAGGEATVALNYNSYTPFTEKQQYYLWRYVNNDNKAVRQVMAGKYSTEATSSIFNPVVGVKITNASTQFRRSFGTYTLTDRTEPNWIVELYVNNVLVDYTTADASGFFTFEVPLVYGNTNVMLKFYGPYGEERTQERNITIPFNFVPKKTLEYSVSAGIVEDNLQSKFSRTSVYYGLSSGITIGSGVEYLSSVSSGELMPFINGSFRLASNLLLSGEFSPEVRSKGTLTYRLPSNLQFDINYIYYTKGQTAINNIFREERKFSMSMPFRLNNFSVYNRFSINQLVLPSTNYTTAEWLISGALFGINTNITSYAVYVGNTKPFYYTDFSFSFRLPKDISIQPRAQYSYTNSEFISAKILVEKRVLKKGYLTGSYEQNFRSNMHMLEFGFRYDFKFAQTSFSARQLDKSTTFVQYARGSIINDSKTNYVYTDNRINVGRGGISIIPFLDKNANGIKDPGEPKVWGLNLRANSGRIEKREIDSTIRIFGLEPYIDCYIEFEQSSLDNIAWRLKFKSMNVAVDPNMIKLLEIPIVVVGEAAGMVRIEQKGGIRGLGRIILNFYDKDQKRIGRTLSEDDGYYSYFGLPPGSFEVRIDTTQLRKLHMYSDPRSVNFNIAANIDGDYVDGLDFIVRLDTLVKSEAPPTMEMLVHEQTMQDLISFRDSYAIEIGPFDNETAAESMLNQLKSLLGKEVVLVQENGLFSLRVNGLETKAEAEEVYPVLQSKGITEIGLITYKGMVEPRMVVIIPGADVDTVKTFTENDTAVLVVHKIEYVDSTSPIDHYAIELGTFENNTEAVAAQNQLNTLLGKEVVLVAENGLYKLRLTGLKTEGEVEDVYPVLLSKGIAEIGVITYTGVPDQDLTVSKQAGKIAPDVPFAEQDTGVVIHRLIEEDSTSSTDRYAIQLGAFRQKGNAYKLRKKLAEILDKEVIITDEDGFYKVRVVGFNSSYEVERYIPMLVRQGIREIWVVTLKGTRKPDLVAGEPDIHRDILETFTMNDTSYLLVHDVFDEVITTDADSYALQLGAFNRKINADILRIKLAAMLGKDVKIFVEDNLYKVRIIGFETRNEAQEYFMELIKSDVAEFRILAVNGLQKYRTAVSNLDTIVKSRDDAGVGDNVRVPPKTTIREVRRAIPDSSDAIKKTVAPERKKDEPRTIPIKVRPAEEAEVKPAPVERVDVEVKTPPVERRKTLEERLLEAEYRSGIYESRWPGVEFTIQIVASKSISDPEVIKKKYELSGDVVVTKDDEWYRFTTGRYIKFWKAREYRNILKTRHGLDGAFILAYKDGKRIMLNDLVVMAETTAEAGHTANLRPPTGNVFSVQVLATRDGNISDSEIWTKFNVDEEIFKEYDERDGLYRYSLGNFDTYTGAVKVRNKIRASGFRDAFVVGYKDGIRVKDLKSIL